MTIPYANIGEQIAAVLALADRCLALEETEHTPEELAGALELEARRERQLRRRCEATVDSGGAAPLEYLFRTFQLTDFERHCVYLSLAAELDSAFERRFSTVQEDNCRLPSLALCLRTFTCRVGERAELLGQWRSRRETLDLFFSEGHRGVTKQSDLTPGLKLERRIPDFFLNYTSSDPALDGHVYESGSDDPAPLVLRGELLERMKVCTASLPSRTLLLFWLQGEIGSGRQTLARHFCKVQGMALVLVELPRLTEDDRWQEKIRAVFRETAIRHAALAFTGLEHLLERNEPACREQEDAIRWEERQPDGRLALRRILEQAARYTDQLFLLSAVPWPPELDSEPWMRVELTLNMPDTAGRILLWQHYLAQTPLEPEVNLDALAEKFALQPGQISAAVRKAAAQLRWDGKTALDSAGLHQSCREQLSHRLGKMASRVNAAYTWGDLILPPQQKQRLQNACAQVEFRHQVYDQWGFGKKVAYGRGLSMLFAGPPGTGKTMAAQVIANRLQLELYKVDLSGVLSKYIGETEKQLGAVFEEVKKSQSILFFDEADALFGKRSETKDAQDRYANVQTSFLLQKMEEYDGIVILASNFLQNFDEAFKRRIKFIIDFTLPDRERREEIWRSVFPAELPRDEDLDFDFLARSFELSGSSIKNIAISAAFLAAEEGVPLGMIHLLLATQTEQNKTGKNLGREEFGEYYHQIQTYVQLKLDRRDSHAGRNS